MAKQTELMYQERLTIRRALEYYSHHAVGRWPAAAGRWQTEKKEAERLQWLFKDAIKVVVWEED